MNLQSVVEIKKNTATTLSQSAVSMLQIVMGSIFLAVMARIAIPLPFTPIPLSMQTLAIFLLGITLGSRKAPLAVMTYLIQASCGLPVLAKGLSNPLWFTTLNGGYLVGFVVVAFLIGYLFEKQSKTTLIKSWLIFALGEITLLTCGTLWLSFFVGLEKAFMIGAAPFILTGLIKITIATCVQKSYSFFHHKTI